MRGLILAAGFGTRLRPITEHLAKPSLPVLGIPGFWYGVWHLSRVLGVREFAMNLCHAPQSLIDAASDAKLRAFTGANFHFSDESKGILGSSGALKQLAKWIGDETLAVMNGDSICLPSWQPMLEFHRENDALLTMHVRQFADEGEGYTDIEVAPDGRILALQPKGKKGLMFDGAYLFEPKLLSRVPTGKSELPSTLLKPLIKEGKLYAYREDVELLDMGTVSSYARAQFELLKRIPSARELVEIKMREEAVGIWIPRDWKHNAGKPALRAPLVVVGSQAEWACAANVLGPNFIGVEPPMPGIKIISQNALVTSGHVQKL